MTGVPRNMLNCDLCGHRCKNEDKLRKHKEQFHSVVPSCSQCLRQFKNESNLENHMNTFHGNKSVRRSDQLKGHRKTSHVEVHSCNSCAKKFSSGKTLAFHEIRVHKNNWAVLDLIENGVSEEIATKIYDKCTGRNTVQNTSENGVKMEESHCVERCEDCNVEMVESAVKDHVTKMHRFDGMSKCGQCRTGIMSRFKKLEHMRMEHGTMSMGGQDQEGQEQVVQERVDIKIKCEECYLCLMVLKTS